MVPRSLYTRSPWLSVRSALFADAATKSPVQHFIQNVLGTTRQFFRGFFKSKSELQSDVFRKQYRLSLEPPVVAPKFNFISYRPGSIYKTTSRWCSNSLTNSGRRELLRKFYRGGSGPLIGFVGFALAKKPSLLTDEEELEGVSYLIRDSFSSLPWEKQGLNIDKDGVLSNITLTDLKIGKLIAKGCNAAIYSACMSQSNDESDLYEKRDYTVQMEMSDDLINSKFFINSEGDIKIQDEKAELNETDMKTDNFCNSQFFISHSEGDQSKGLSVDNNKCKTVTKFPTGSFGQYNMAVKVMFNYDAESNAFAIWNAMYKETLPSIGEFSLGDSWRGKVRKKKLKTHPNIVEMYSAFPDQLPLLPGAVKNFPLALPTRLQNDGCGRNMTLFIVMKRYHCSLKDYLQSQNISSETALLLFAQLLEALVHLLKNGVAHRDLKSDNILLDLSQGLSSPRLAVTDFGCCLENLSLVYTSHDVSKGGNMSLMAPEVVNTEPGLFSTIDYSRADLWAAGAIAYEIFGESNPFYSNFKNYSYEEEKLPPFPTKAPAAIQILVMEILHVNPHQRPSPNFAASVCQTLLHAPSSLLTGPFDNSIRKKALEWMFQLSAQTYLEVSVRKTEPLPVKLELCRTFCSRIQYLEIIQALQYILEK